MRKRLSWGAALSLMIIVVAVTVCVTMLVAMRRFNTQVNELNNRQAMYNYIADVDNAVRQNYYGTIDEEVLRHAMAHGQVNGIGDKYARYLTTEEYNAHIVAMSGQSTGFGITVVANESGQIVLSDVQFGSTAYSAGLQKGDVVVALNKASLGNEPLRAVEEALASSSTVLLTVQRDGKETAFELSAAAYARECVESELNGTVGYLRIKSITDVTPDQVHTAYTSLKDQGAAMLVLDLRGSESGSVEATKKILSLLLPHGLYGYYVDKDGTTELRAENTAQLDIPTAVLVNRKTAGEAELIAATLRQAGRAVLVGNTTAGRSMVQEYFTLTSDNSAVCFTVGEFQLLDKSGWEGVGLTPDVISSLSEEQEDAWELLSLSVDPQYQAAVAKLAAMNEQGGTTTTTTTTTTTVTTTTTDTADATTTAGGDGATATTTAAGE
ncbi:MAG: PDZ domain-containing protein [Ruminococcaceae bacterium]|nr:PDZ domain-containing protein [Oscillospiraceae bacterium]